MTSLGRPAVTVDVVVVTYQSGAWIEGCLRSLVDQPNVGRVVVVDSASTDDTVLRARSVAPSASIVSLGVNRGFGSAANQGVSATSSEFVLLLNADLVVMPGIIQAMVAPMLADPTCGIVGPDVQSMDGRSYPSARSFPNLVDAAGHGFLGLVWKSNPFSKRYLHPKTVEWISGTAMLVRRSVFEAVGGFDESYFMYVEDVDLCWRLRHQGAGVAVAKDAVVRHAIGGSSQSAPYRMIVAHHRSLWRFAWRSTVGLQRAALPLVGLGLVARAGAACAKRLIDRRPPAVR